MKDAKSQIKSVLEQFPRGVTVADVVSQTGLTRAIVAYGIKRIPGISMSGKHPVIYKLRSVGPSPAAALPSLGATERETGRREFQAFLEALGMDAGELVMALDNPAVYAIITSAALGKLRKQLDEGSR